MGKKSYISKQKQILIFSQSTQNLFKASESDKGKVEQTRSGENATSEMDAFRSAPNYPFNFCELVQREFQDILVPEDHE